MEFQNRGGQKYIVRLPGVLKCYTQFIWKEDAQTSAGRPVSCENPRILIFSSISLFIKSNDLSHYWPRYGTTLLQRGSPP